MDGHFFRKVQAVLLLITMSLSLLGIDAMAYAAPAHENKMIDLEQTLTMPDGTPPYPDKIVKGVSPLGTRIDLFDYWITGRFDQDNWDDRGAQDADQFLQGINKNHALLFSRSGPRTDGWNKWTRNESPYPNILQPTLGEDRYPRLRLDTNNANEVKGTDGNESLAYLFDPTIEVEGKASFENVKDLLQVDDEGYFYYDSAKNYATYYEDSNSFTLYKYPGVISNGTGDKRIVGQFFPFNVANADGEQVTHEGKTYNVMQKSKSREDATLNHYFGMHMTTSFIQKYGGHTNQAQTDEVTYEFSGDDDVWVFIDGVLVADLGGIHDKAGLSINFANGDIQINNPGEDGHKKSTLKQMFIDAGKVGSERWRGNTFADDSTHTLDFFFMERGNTDSNMSLKFNLVYIPETSLIKVDQMGDMVPGATFELRLPGNETIATGTTDRNGSFTFKKANGNLITLQEIYAEYGPEGKGIIDATDEETDLVLVETRVPPGYRDTGDIHLRFYESAKGELLLFSDNLWDTGAYAMPNVTTVVGRKLALFDVTKGTVGQQPVKEVTLKNDAAPLMFAVVFQKQADNTWRPIYGDPVKGWKITEGNTWQDIITAAKANPYPFRLSTSGGYTTTVEKMPGDVRKYYYLNQDLDQAEFSVQYYYSEAEKLDDINANNTWLVGETDNHPIYRMFAADIYVPNVKNHLFVKKVDESGMPLEQAVFSLYKAEDVSVDHEGNYIVDAQAVPYDTVITANDERIISEFNGTALFPSEKKKILEEGIYYLVEEEAPKDYIKCSQITKVIVGPDGVYADAGAKNDDVSVLRGVGSLLKSMAQFAGADYVDATLHDIKTTLQSGVIDGSGALQWQPTQWSDDAWVQHLKYKNDGALLEYGPLVAGENVGIKIDEGWGRLSVRQCMEHNDPSTNQRKYPLGDQDLTNLFSGICIVEVTNKKVGDIDPQTGVLRITKTVEGNAGDKDKTWTFSVTLKDAQGQPLSGDFAYTHSDGTAGYIQNGERFGLKDGEVFTLKDLPVGTTYEVTEAEEGQDGYTTTKSGHIGLIMADIGATAAFINTKDIEVPPPMDKSDLTITKTVEGNAGDKDKTWTFSVTLKNAQGQPLSGDFAYTHSDGTAGYIQNGESFGLKDGEVFNLKDLPVGTTYEVVEREANQDGYTTEATGESGSIEKDHTATAAFTNTKNTEVPPPIDNGHLTITKTVSGNQGDKTKDWHFTVILKDKNGQALNDAYAYSHSDGSDGYLKSGDVVTLKDGQRVTVDGLPVGTTYEVIETEANQDGYTTDATGESGSIEKDRTATAAFTNTKNTEVPPPIDNGHLTITKTVSGNQGDKTKDWHFTVILKDKNGQALNDDYAYSHSDGSDGYLKSGDVVTLKDGQRVTVDGLPVGTTYEVIETEANQDGYTTDATGESGSIEKDRTATAAFTNTKNTEVTPPIDNGHLTITKTVSGNQGDKTKDWHFTVTLKGKNNNTLTGRYPYKCSDGGSGMIKSGDSFSLKHGQSMTINDLPVGATYTVVETEANKDGYTTNATGESGTIEKNRTATAAFTNTKNTEVPPPIKPQIGHLTITKTVSGNQGDKTKDWHFTVTLKGQNNNTLTSRYPYKCSDGAGGTIKSGESFSLKHGQSLTINDLPVGATYTVVETEADQDGYITTAMNDKGTIKKNQTASASFTNTKRGVTPPPSVGDVGDLVIEKTVSGTKGDKQREWTFTVTLKNDKGQALTDRYAYKRSDGTTGTLVSGDVFTLQHGQTLTLQGIPVGSHYAVVEKEANKDGYTTKMRGENGTIVKNKTAKATFTNTKNSTSGSTTTTPPSKPNTNTPQTGDPRMTWLWGLLCLASLGGLVLVLKGRGKHFSDKE